MQVLDEIKDAENELEVLKAKYLLKNGWERDCQNPACIWLWCKEIKGKVYCVNTDTAFSFQQII